MKRLILAMCCAVAASFVVVSAQSGTMDHDKTMKQGMKNVTMTGCVAEGTGGQYMLTDATKGHAKSDMKTGTTGHMKGDMKGMTYDLMGGENLKPHVGHKVEITGMMDSSKMMKNRKMDKDKMDKDEMGTSDSAHGTITVKSMKMISTTCS
jgi:hypothetical protein